MVVRGTHGTYDAEEEPEDGSGRTAEVSGRVERELQAQLNVRVLSRGELGL